MKFDCYVWVAVLGFFAFTPVARADSAEPAGPDLSDPSLQVDADGVPISLSSPKATPLTADQIAEIRKEQAQAALDKDWLMRNYEKQLQKNAAARPGDDQSSNLFYQLSSNRDLAKLAGLPELDDGTPDYRTNEAQAEHNAMALRHPSPSPTSTLGGGAFLKPFIAPLGAPEAAGLSNFYSSLGGSAVTSLSGSVPRPSAAKVRTPADEDPADIETPGMIAAEKNPNPDTLDLTLDVLPDESIEHARAHQDNDAVLALPLPMDADQLHRAQAVALSPKGSTQAQAEPTPVVPKVIPVNPDDAPLPVSKEPVINPVRAPIGNPYDILNQ